MKSLGAGSSSLIQMDCVECGQLELQKLGRGYLSSEQQELWGRKVEKTRL